MTRRPIPYPTHGTPEGGHPVGSPEAQAAIERVKAVINRNRKPHTATQKRGPRPQLVSSEKGGEE
jgi:hypothetical protein